MAFEYIPGDDYFHRRDPRAKMFMAVVIVVMSVWFNDPIWLISLFVFELIILRLARIPLSKIAGFIRGISPVAILYLLFNLIMPPVVVSNPLVLFHIVFWTTPRLLPVSVESLVWGVGALFRFLIILVMIRTLLMLTSIRDLILALVRLRIPPEFALAVSIGLGYLPVMIDENRRISEALQARGWEYEFRNPAKRFSALLTKMLVPSIANSMRRTRDIATAIESKGFGYNLRARTFLHEIKMKAGDYILFVAFLSLLIGSAYIRGIAVQGQLIFGLGLADFQATARFIRAWPATPAATLFANWMALINWAAIPWIGLIPISYLYVEYGQYLFLLLVGLAAGLISGIISRGRNRKITILLSLVIALPIWLIIFYFIWPTLTTTFPVLLSGGAIQAILALDMNTFLAYFLLFFVTMLWPYFGSLIGSWIGRIRGGEKKIFVPPDILPDETEE